MYVDLVSEMCLLARCPCGSENRLRAIRQCSPHPVSLLALETNQSDSGRILARAGPRMVGSGSDGTDFEPLPEFTVDRPVTHSAPGAAGREQAAALRWGGADTMSSWVGLK